MRKHLLPLFAAASLAVSAPVFAVNPDVQAAIDLMKQTHADQCQKQKIRSQLLAAHQQHEQDKLNELEPRLDAINKRMKPTEDKLNALKASFKKNPDDESAFEEGLMQIGDCE